MAREKVVLGMVILGVLFGAAAGFGLYLCWSPLPGDQGFLFSQLAWHLAAGAIIGGFIVFMRIRSNQAKQELLAQKGGAMVLRRKKQKRALWIGAILFCLMGIFPPWKITTLSPDGHTSIDTATRYRFIWDEPHVTEHIEGASVDGKRLLVGWAVVVVLTSVSVAGRELTAKKEE